LDLTRDFGFDLPIVLLFALVLDCGFFLLGLCGRASPGMVGHMDSVMWQENYSVEYTDEY